MANDLKMKIKHQKNIVGRYRTIITTYLAIHND
jgi:hypothetical protein